MPTLKQSIDIPLQVPVTYEDSDGKPATRSTLTFRRPTLKHAKSLAVIVGPQLASLLMPAIKSNTDEINTETMISGLSDALFTPGALDSLTEIIADMSGESTDIINRLDWLDLFAVFRAFFGFFPRLQSAMPDNLQQS